MFQNKNYLRLCPLTPHILDTWELRSCLGLCDIYLASYSSQADLSWKVDTLFHKYHGSSLCKRLVQKNFQKMSLQNKKFCFETFLHRHYTGNSPFWVLPLFNYPTRKAYVGKHVWTLELWCMARIHTSEEGLPYINLWNASHISELRCMVAEVPFDGHQRGCF